MIELSLADLRQLLEQVARKDQSAIARLYYHHEAFVRRYIESRLGAWDTVIDEVVNDTFLVVCRKPQNFNFGSRFSTWLCGIAENKIKDRLRTDQRYSHRFEALDEESAGEFPDMNVDLLAEIERGEMDSILKRCLGELSPVQGQALWLAIYDEQPLDVIAQLQACPLGTVKTRVMHARNKLADCMKQTYATGAHR